MIPKPRKGKMGWIQGTCTRCNTSTKPLVKYKSEYVCSTCVQTIIDGNAGKKQVKSDERERMLFLERTTPVQ